MTQRVCMVSDHGCIRVFKEAYALTLLGWKVEIASRLAPFGYNQFDAFHLYMGRDQLKRVVESSKADIFHVHNEPDWLVKPVAEAAGGRPVVYDVHDLESLRWKKPPDALELEAFDYASAIVHISETAQNAAHKYHSLGKPETIVRSFVNQAFVPDVVPKSVSFETLVYEGGLSTSPLIANEEKAFMDMRNLGPLVEAFIDENFNVYLFSPNDVGSLMYENMGAVVVMNTPYNVLLAALRSFGMGFVGAMISAPLMEAALPNKLFEYISQGVVPIVWNCAESAKFIEEHGIGIELNGLDNLREQLDPFKLKAKRANLLEIRHRLTMENEIHKLVELYERL